MSEVEKLHQYCVDTKSRIMGITTGYELGLTDKKPTAEEIAGSINEMHKWLADPVNNLVSRIGGHLFLKKDTVMCLENKCQVVDREPYFEPVGLTDEEKMKVARYKEDIKLFEDAITMIEELAAKIKVLENNV